MKSIFRFLSMVALVAFSAMSGAQTSTYHINDAGGIVDPSGKPVRIRGVNRIHWDQTGPASGVPLTGANTERIGFNWTRSPASNWAIVQSQIIDQGMIPVVGNWDATGRQDVASLSKVVDTWIAQKSTWTKLNETGIVNIANEQGAGALTNTRIDNFGHWAMVPNHLWRDGYIPAVQRMRDAGYIGLLMIDAGYNGQDWQTILLDGRSVLSADPLHNIVFSLHVYAGPGQAYTTPEGLKAVFDALQATRLPIIIGEFGPGRNVGPSPTMLDPTVIIAEAEAHDFGWLAWAWDDNNLDACGADDRWFAMSTSCGKYTGVASELTTFGKAVVPMLRGLNGAPKVN